MGESMRRIVETSRKRIQGTLQLISSLDQRLQATLSHYRSLQAQLFARMATKGCSKFTKSSSHQLSLHLLELQKSADSLSKEKIRLANQLYCILSEVTEDADNLMPHSRRPNLPVCPLERLLTECLREQTLSFCICDEFQRQGISPQELMVACQGSACPKKWYHLACLGIDPESLPETFLCDICSCGASNETLGMESRE